MLWISVASTICGAASNTPVGALLLYLSHSNHILQLHQLQIVSVQFKATRCIAEAVSHSNVHPDVLALWPLLSSAALQLAHAALGCIHVINTKLKMTGRWCCVDDLQVSCLRHRRWHA
jgi:hypothetical protein